MGGTLHIHRSESPELGIDDDYNPENERISRHQKKKWLNLRVEDPVYQWECLRRLPPVRIPFSANYRPPAYINLPLKSIRSKRPDIEPLDHTRVYHCPLPSLEHPTNPNAFCFFKVDFRSPRRFALTLVNLLSKTTARELDRALRDPLLPRARFARACEAALREIVPHHQFWHLWHHRVGIREPVRCLS